MNLAKKGWIEIQNSNGIVVGNAGGVGCYLPNIWGGPVQHYNSSPKPVYYLARSEALDCLHEEFFAAYQYSFGTN